MPRHPRILSVATAVPPHRLHQDEVKEETGRLFASLPEIDRLLPLFDRAGVEWRHMAFPKAYYLEPRGFGARNDDYIRVALELGETAIRRALDRAGLGVDDVDTLLFTTTTGLATPSVDALLAERLGMRPGVRRIPLFGLGCAGGAAGLALAADRLRARPGEVAVVLSVELCSLTWNLDALSKVNLVGIALFADGAGCAVLAGAERSGGPASGAAVTAAETVRFPESGHLMGWEFSEAGFGLVLSPGVPAFIAEELPPRVTAFLERHDTARDGVRHFALHPGGRQVIAAYRRGLGLSEDDVAPTREALRRNGNLSSASVFFSLDEVWRTRSPGPGERGLVAAMGPGFAAEMLLLEWSRDP